MKNDQQMGETSVADVETLGAMMRQARKRQGLTQQQFADIAGVGVRFLSELERGKETAEVGLVLQVVQNTGFDLILRPRDQRRPAFGGRHAAESERGPSKMV